MAGNTSGQVFQVTTFGESHGTGIGLVIDGCPAGLEIDIDFLQNELDRRRPGQSDITTQRKEPDTFEILSGVFENRTIGTPIAFLIRNQDQQSKDYSHLQDAFRPSHADYTWQSKYGIRDHRGGGRSSARETASRVLAGAVAKLLLRTAGIQVSAYVSQVGPVKVDTPYTALDLSQTESNIVRCPDPVKAKEMIEYIEKVRKSGDTIGGVVNAVITGCPPGLGEPVFDKLHAELSKAMMSINATRGFEYGSGFDAVTMKGSEHNDIFEQKAGKISTSTNRSGGIQGGISNGMDIYFKVAFKPVATIMQDQNSVNEAGEKVTVSGKGRHDPCVVPRAVPIVEAMAALVLADHLLRNRNAKIVSE